MSSASLVVLLGWVSVATAAGAPPSAVAALLASSTPASHDVALAAAASDFDALRLEEAADRLEALVQDPTTPSPTKARAFLLLGQTRAGLVDDGAAARAFADALALEPALELPPDTSPKVQTLFAGVQNATRKTTLTTPAATPGSTTPTTSTRGPSGSNSAPAREATGSVGDADDADDAVVWAAGTGGVLLVTALAAGVGAVVADDALGRPAAGRTRAEHDQLRVAGLTGLVASAVLGVAGVAGLIAAGFWSVPGPEEAS